MTQNNCPQCGAPIAGGVTECKYCGEPIKYQQPAYQQPVAQQPVYQQPVAPQPVYQQPAAPQPVYQQPVYQQPPYQPQFQPGYNQMNAMYDGINPAWPIKSKAVAGILGIFLGGLGIHKFYLGKAGMGVLYLLFCWTAIPAFIGFIEGIIYLVSNDHNFQVKNRVRLQ